MFQVSFHWETISEPIKPGSIELFTRTDLRIAQYKVQEISATGFVVQYLKWNTAISDFTFEYQELKIASQRDYSSTGALVDLPDEAIYQIRVFTYGQCSVSRYSKESANICLQSSKS